MAKKGIILTILGSIFALAIAGGLSYVGFSNYYKPVQGNIDVIEISQENMVGSFEYDFGIVSPGESKEQRIQVSSIANSNLDYQISINGESQLAFQYIDVNVHIGEEKVYSSLLFGCVNQGSLFKRALAPSSKEEIIFTYSLKDDIPEEIMGENVAFEITFSAKLFNWRKQNI